MNSCLYILTRNGTSAAYANLRLLIRFTRLSLIFHLDRSFRISFSFLQNYNQEKRKDEKRREGKEVEEKYKREEKRREEKRRERKEKNENKKEESTVYQLFCKYRCREIRISLGQVRLDQTRIYDYQSGRITDQNISNL